MGSKRMVWSRWMVAIGLIGVIAAGFSWFLFRPGKIQDRVYTIGWEHNPPSQERGADGNPGGFGIDLIREAARRRGIRLQWVEMPHDSEAAIRSGRADLWPMMVITPERRKVLHLTEPFYRTEQCYVVRASGPFREPRDLAEATISYVALPVNYRLLHAQLPRAHAVPKNRPAAVLDEVCLHKADAAFLDEHAAISALLQGGSCSAEPFRLISTPAETPEGIASTFAAAGAADALREEIGAIAGEGKLAGVLSRGGYFSGRIPESMENLLRARRRERWLTIGIAAASVLLLLTFLQAVRIRRERNKARRAEQALREAEEKYRTMIETAPDGILIFDSSSRLLEVNSAACKQIGYTRERMLALRLDDITAGGYIERIADSLQDLVDGVRTFESCHRRADGNILPVELNIRRTAFQGKPAFLSVVRDIADRKQAERERSKLEEQLRQSQRLETVGRLAGGVAHDFNNLLTVINGYSGTLVEHLKPDDPKREQAAEILKAGQRAADLTQQLLAFSRRQVMHPKPLDLNQVISQSSKMLRRLVSEDIEMAVTLGPALGWVMADPDQISQVLMDLVVNARDAMPGGGRITIATSNEDLDRPRGEVPAGSYVQLMVADTGTGMDTEVQKHIFEPFFTTKGFGEGSGLGLATVYGAVRQGGGYIDVTSEPGEGTFFRVYLPRIPGDSPPAERTAAAASDAGGSQTILVVEDQDAVRDLMVDVLRDRGYNLLEAASGNQAIELASAHPGPIHLLLTDVVMPGISGRQVAKTLQPRRPEMKVLYTSGYSPELIAHHGVSEAAYLPKPFLPEDLAAKVRAVLGAA
jgi:two-component system, cell cycle sensor histidine kinase and response regulator CckA